MSPAAQFALSEFATQVEDLFAGTDPDLLAVNVGPNVDNPDMLGVIGSVRGHRNVAFVPVDMPQFNSEAVLDAIEAEFRHVAYLALEKTHADH